MYVAEKRKKLKKLNNKKACPFLHDPDDKCYCIHLNSQNIEKAIFFCGQHFEECRIFKIVYQRRFSALKRGKESHQKTPCPVSN
jgi:hypothetical protein